MDGFNQHLKQLQDLNTNIVAATAQSQDKAQEVAEKVDFPVAYGVTLDQANELGSWWEDRRQLIQPSDFVLNAQATVLSATYSTGPVGRLEAADAVRFIQFQEKLKQQQ